MSAYKGTATIVGDGGEEIADVEVELVVPEQEQVEEPWFATIWGDFDAFDLMEGTPTLRLPDGREGRFRLSRTDLVLPRIGIGIVGLDAASF